VLAEELQFAGCMGSKQFVQHQSSE
jgi:hypothetical protein